MGSKFVDVYSLPPVPNVCDQILREVVSLPKVSMAHVIMDSGNVSLWHKHSRMTEVYFILEGEGILYHGSRAMRVRKGAYLVILAGTPHKLKNTGSTRLEHLVFAIPPFDPEDVILLDEKPEEFQEHEFRQEKEPITALDGALVYELMTPEERRKYDVALAVGILPRARKAIPHYHKKSEELYYIISGQGKVRIGEKEYPVKKGSLARIPVGVVHALENTSQDKDLEVLCVSSPAYTDGDFIIAEKSKP